MKLSERRCSAETARHCPASDEISSLLATLPGWQRQGAVLSKTFTFTDYYQTMAFVNALAWIAHQENHHPDLAVHYNRVVVNWSTHDAGGLTLNDFICASKCQALLQAEA